MKELIIIKFADAWKKYGTKYDWAYYKKRPMKIVAIQMDEEFFVKTKEGVMKGKVGDYLIEGIRGEVYPCDKKIFEESYVKVR